MSDSPARVYTIPPSAPFLPTLATALAEGRLIEGFRPKDNPLSLASATVFLPTRRAVRIFSTSLFEAIGQEALILPRILPLGDVDEDELAFEENGADLPPAIPTAGRRLVLAQLVLQWARATSAEERLIAATPAAALAFADELAQVLDDLTIAGIPHEKLIEAVPHDFDRYWETSRAFLGIVWREWPNILREQNKIDPTEIDFVAAHATATDVGDVAETEALKAAFGDHAYKLAISANKSSIGHLLGAAGAASSLSAILAIRDQVAPPTLNLTDPDPRCDLNYTPLVKRAVEVNASMASGFGFGGQNAVCLFRKYEG